MFLKENKKENIQFLLRESNRQIFEISFFSYLVFFTLDEIWDKVISSYFNLNILLAIAIITGALSLVPGFRFDAKKAPAEATPKDYLFIFLLGIIGALIIFFKVEGEFWFKLLIALISGVLIILLSMLIINDNKD